MITEPRLLLQAGFCCRSTGQVGAFFIGSANSTSQPRDARQLPSRGAFLVLCSPVSLPLRGGVSRKADGEVGAGTFKLSQ